MSLRRLIIVAPALIAASGCCDRAVTRGVVPLAAASVKLYRAADTTADVVALELVAHGMYLAVRAIDVACSEMRRADRVCRMSHAYLPRLRREYLQIARTGKRIRHRLLDVALLVDSLAESIADRCRANTLRTGPAAQQILATARAVDRGVNDIRQAATSLEGTLAYKATWVAKLISDAAEYLESAEENPRQQRQRNAERAR